MDSGNVVEYRPYEISYGSVENKSVFPLIILNQPLDHFHGVILTCFKAMCDGGANRFHTFLGHLNLNPDDFLPDIVSGDFDSINNDILAFYQTKLSTNEPILRKQCKVLCTPDQDHTDFTKSFNLVMTEMEKRKINLDFLVAITDTKGRFDHILGNIQTLYHAKTITNIPVYLLSEKSITWLLTKGKHRILVSEEMMKYTCGLLPIGEPCVVTTTGLKWNLTGDTLQFGGLVSTSNTYTDKIVTVETDKPIIWTMEVKAEP
uniref:Thiamin pyrophosphokinase thiamin-binding domain-containing protein n=1 Tax=Strigamia maritima TaxID=126957 RepID=T1JED9_STRMM